MKPCSQEQQIPAFIEPELVFYHYYYFEEHKGPFLFNLLAFLNYLVWVGHPLLEKHETLDATRVWHLQ